jgi:cytochrome c
MKNFGAGIAIVALFLVPVMLFFYVVTTPILAMSGNLFALAVAVTAVLFVAFVFLYFSLIGTRARFGGTAFMLFLIVFLLLSVGDQLTLVNATKEHTASLVTKWEEEEARRQLEREAEMSGGARPDAAKGEEVFNSLCSTCHRMDERLVGPPLNTVLPKYAGNPAGLVEFISNPTKVNQDYPPMPKPALSLAEIRSVVLYLTGEDPTTGAESSPGH